MTWRDDLDELADFGRAMDANSNVHPHPSAKRREDEPRRERPRPEAERDAEAPGRTFGRLRLLTVEDALNAPAREYLLDGLIAPAEFSVWWGAPKCGKSFLLLRIAYGMAQGLGMWGREAEAVSVCYVAAEGGHGIKGRIHALRKRMGAAPGFHFIAQAVDLFDPQEDLEDLIDAVKAVGARFVVLDTLARVMGAGNENATPDMNAFVRNCLRIQEETEAHVAVVHHGGWEGSHARGSIALIGAADIVVKVSGEQGGPKTALVELAKDDDSGYPLGFDLAEMELPLDAKGRPRKTFIAEEREAPPREAAREKPLTESQRGWLSDIQDLFAAPEPAVERVPVAGMRGVRTLTREEVREGLRGKGRFTMEPHGALTQKDRDRLREALNQLKDRRKIGMTDKLVWLL